MDKQKQIDGIYEAVLGYKFTTPSEKFSYDGMCEAIFKAGYCRIPEGAVVLSKEQNENWLSFLEQNIEKARKEAVEKFVELLLSEYAAFEEEDEILIKDMRGDIQDVAKALIGGEYAEIKEFCSKKRRKKGGRKNRE